MTRIAVNPVYNSHFVRLGAKGQNFANVKKHKQKTIKQRQKLFLDIFAVERKMYS